MKKLLFLVLLLVGCSKFPGKKTYEDNRIPIEIYLNSTYPHIRDVSCLSNELIRYANEYCGHYFRDDNITEFVQCYKDGGSFANLQHAFYALTVLNCELAEFNADLKKKVEVLQVETDQIVKEVEEIGNNIKNSTGP